MPKKKILPDQCKDTGMALVLILLLLALAKRSFSFLGPAIALLIITMSAPALFTPVAQWWFALSHGLGKVMSTLLLGVVFFLVVTPVAVFRRLIGRDAMGLGQWRDGGGSAFVRREHTFTAADLEKPF